MKNKTLIDTHAHINMMVKKSFDTLLTSAEISYAHEFIEQANKADVSTLINVGTSLIESRNCVSLAHTYPNVWAVVGIHPNDCTESWRSDFNEIKELVRKNDGRRIVGIGECGIDKHYPDYMLSRQYDAFRAHIELALEHDLALVVHSRDAYDETLMVLDEYKNDIQRGVMHCFSYDQQFANHVIQQNFILGIGGTVTYPKNNELRTIVQNVDLAHIVLETDAPFLPPQPYRGQQNHPQYIAFIADYIAQLKQESVEHVADVTTRNARNLFQIKTE